MTTYQDLLKQRDALDAQIAEVKRFDYAGGELRPSRKSLSM